MSNFVKSSCPKCGSNRRKNWYELDTEELLLVKKLPRNTDFSIEQRKQHQFCVKCWHEFTVNDGILNEYRT